MTTTIKNADSLESKVISEVIKDSKRYIGATIRHNFSESEREPIDMATKFVQEQSTNKQRGRTMLVRTGIEVDNRTGKVDIVMPITANNFIKGHMKNRYENFGRVAAIQARLRRKAEEKGIEVNDEHLIAPRATYHRV